MKEKLLYTRQSFIGTYDGCNIIESKSRHKAVRYTIVFKNVYFKSSNEIFRDHVHIVVTKSVFNMFKNIETGIKDYSFTAQLYRYTQPPIKHKNMLYRPFQIGLRDIKKIKKTTNIES